MHFSDIRKFCEHFVVLFSTLSRAERLRRVQMRYALFFLRLSYESGRAERRK